jgi:hypothetical protein
MNRRSVRLVLALVPMMVGCEKMIQLVQEQRHKADATPPPTTAPAPQGPVAEAKALLEQGQLDAALAKLQEAVTDPDAPYYQGLVWAKKAETAPLPTPPPLTAPLPRGAEPPAASEYKPEEVQAAASFEKAVAARPGHAQAQLALAELLAPHAARRYDREEAARKKPQRRGKHAGAEATPTGEPDDRPEHVAEAYQKAIQADPSSKEPVEALIRFGQRVGRPEDADVGLRELIRRDNQNGEPLIRYGDFLKDVRRDPLAAVEQYRQALIWRADDEATRAKVADIFITMAIDNYNSHQYANADARLKEAQKYISDKNSPQGLRAQDYINKLGAIRTPTKN